MDPKVIANPITSAVSAENIANLRVSTPENKDGHLMRNQGSNIDLASLYQQQVQMGYGPAQLNQVPSNFAPVNQQIIPPQRVAPAPPAPSVMIHQIPPQVAASTNPFQRPNPVAFNQVQVYGNGFGGADQFDFGSHHNGQLSVPSPLNASTAAPALGISFPKSTSTISMTEPGPMEGGVTTPQMGSNASSNAAIQVLQQNSDQVEKVIEIRSESTEGLQMSPIPTHEETTDQKEIDGKLTLLETLVLIPFLMIDQVKGELSKAPLVENPVNPPTTPAGPPPKRSSFFRRNKEPKVDQQAKDSGE